MIRVGSRATLCVFACVACLMMSNEREQIESQGHASKATPDARISRTTKGGAEPHPNRSSALLGNGRPCTVACALCCGTTPATKRHPKTGHCSLPSIITCYLQTAEDSLKKLLQQNWTLLFLLQHSMHRKHLT